MTISTRAALEAISSMFGGQQQQQQPSGGPTAATAQQQQQPSHQGRGCAAPAAPAVLPQPAGFHPATAGMQDGLADSPGGDGGGGGFMIHEDTQFVSVPLGLADGGGSDAGASPRLSPAASLGGGDGDSGGLFGGDFSIREDTMFVTVPVSVAPQQEQQQAVGGAPAAGPPAPPGLQAAGGGGSGVDREDGLFGGGFSIREDTQFIGGAPAAGSPAAASDGGHSDASIDVLAAGSGGSGGGSGVPGRKRPLGSPCLSEGGDEHSGTGAAQVISEGMCRLGWGCERGTTSDPLLPTLVMPHVLNVALHSVMRLQVGKWGFAPGADDTLALQLQLGDTQALLDAVTAAAAADPVAAAQLQAAAAAGGASSGLTLHLQGLQLGGGEDKENIVSAAAAAATATTCGRRLSDPSVAAAALQPLDAQRCEELGVCQEALDAEQVAAVAAAAEELAAGDAAAGDNFAVWCDAAADGSPPLMGSPLGSGNSCQADAAPVVNVGAAASPPLELQNQQQPEVAEVWQGAGPPAGLQTPATPAAPIGSYGAAEELSSPCDPFSPAFQSRMLACLEPAVAEVRRRCGEPGSWNLPPLDSLQMSPLWTLLQWPGVHCLSSTEEAEAVAGFKAARRGGSSGGLVELQLCGLEFAVRWAWLGMGQGHGDPAHAAQSLAPACLPAAAWWARARTPACSAAWTATAPTWRSSCRRRPAPGSGAGWRCCCCAAAAAAATAMSLPQSDLAGFHCFA